ncbi:hypothetical protein P7C65_04s1g04770 [Encephalitozoon intestinalis]|nr:hypothetical protein GPK93_04g05100 [Encephalitozoon intestinalis]UTX46154.1 hypothetical protein GPK93_10g17480 [Encephalitozoon intestinalis]
MARYLDYLSKIEKEERIFPIWKRFLLIMDIIFTLLIVTVFIFRSKFKDGSIFLQIVGWGSLIDLVYSTVVRLYFKVEKQKKLKSRDVIEIMFLFLHLLMIAFLVCNNFVFKEVEIRRMIDVVGRNPVGIFWSSLILIGGQNVVKSHGIPSFTDIGMQMGLVMTSVVGFNYNDDKPPGIELKHIVFCFFGAMLYSIEIWMISKLKIPKREGKKLRRFIGIILAIAYTMLGYYMLNKIFSISIEKMAV